MDGGRGFPGQAQTCAHGRAVEIVAGDEQAGLAVARVSQAGRAFRVSDPVLGQSHRPVPDPGHGGVAAGADEIPKLGPRQVDQIGRRKTRQMGRLDPPCRRRLVHAVEQMRGDVGLGGDDHSPGVKVAGRTRVDAEPPGCAV